MDDREAARAAALGEPLPGWTRRPAPPDTPLAGRFVRVERFDPLRHAADLFAGYAEDREGRLWDYLPYGPFLDRPAYEAHCQRAMTGADPMFHAILDAASGRADGVAALMRIDPENGVVEVGHIAYAPRLMRRPGGTEAMYLLARRVFDELGYRRYEWKCNALNAPSMAAALRLGFTYEGTFRSHMVVKGRNRDTAWYAMTDREWPARRAAFEAWLDPSNFGPDGRQRRRLADLR